ncbi:MAG TPA: sodium:solute symporter family protein [Candidatus Deferrimicrobium sp.]|nr:sodium:solute symporter family protein [Candidatus Deferrimicrobium sp.]
MYLTGLFVYFVLLAIIGIVVSRKNPDFDAYFYGERKMGSFLIFFTVTASWFGAASIIATANAAYKTGFNALWMLCIPTLTTIIIFIIINKKVRETRFISLPVLLEKYYGKAVAGFASFLIFFYMVVLAASQLVAWGTFAGNFIGTGYGITVIIGAAVVILYSYLGGYLSIVFTDALQFLMITVSLIYFVSFLKNSPSTFKPTDYNFFAGSGHNLLMTLSFTLAWVISPIIWQKIASARSAKSSRWGLLMSLGALAFFYILVIQAGVYTRNFPATENTADVLSIVIKNWLPVGGSILVFLGIAAAITSTAATAINVGALTLVKDVILIKRKNRTALYARIATFICGALAVLVALRFNSIIKTLGLASEIMAEGLFIPGMYMLFFKKKKPLAALLSLILGGGFSIVVFINAYGLSLPLPQWPESLPYGLGLSLLGFVLGYLLDKKK